MKFRLAPSLAAAPIDRLSQVMVEFERAGVDYLHFDIEDGAFVPAMRLGTKIIADLRPLSKLPFDVHLMMVNPEWVLPEVIKFGADRIATHYEASAYPRRVLHKIVSLGAQAGIALNPTTPLPDLRYLLPYLSFIVILTTEPEVPDGPFLSEILNKVRTGKKSPGLAGLEWVVDGGVDSGNILEVVRAGADTIVVGRALFNGPAIADTIAALRKCLKNPGRAAFEG